MQSDYSELLSHGLGGCASEAEQNLSNTDILSLERMLADFSCPEGAAIRFGLTGYHFQDVQVDGEEDVSLASLKVSLDRKSIQSNQYEETSDGAPRPTMPAVSQKVLQEIVQNNLRLQKSLQEVASIKGSSYVSLCSSNISLKLLYKLAHSNLHFPYLILG